MATMVLLGINRIIVTNGRINAKVVFDMKASDQAKRVAKAELEDEREKKKAAMAAERKRFLERAKEKGIDSRAAAKVFELMEYFAGYGFNKSHSAAYALVAYQTAWLKAHYPVHFMAALLTTEKGNTDKLVS